MKSVYSAVRTESFEHVKEFFHLGSQLNQTNSINCEIRARIISANRCYYSCGALMKSRALNRSSKLKIYTTLIRPAVTYGFEIWTLTRRNEQQLRIFERKISKKLFGPVRFVGSASYGRTTYKPVLTTFL